MQESELLVNQMMERLRRNLHLNFLELVLTSRRLEALKQ